MKELSELALPGQLKYAKDHEWINAEPLYRIGVSDFAQDQLGDITFAELPEVGAELGQGDEFGTLESIKSVSSLYLPVAGKIVAVNEALINEPGLGNSDPYGKGWLIHIEPA
ncbi:MAG: glycine cleavage system protein GcvH, partial [Planctomycetes bacterium]|nr:glycine cleavage system protein GcvH [Planctomycetota bacterium]